MKQKVLKFYQNNTGMWVSSLITRQGTYLVRASKKYEESLKETFYVCRLKKLKNGDLLAVDMQSIEENPLFSYYVDASRLGVFLSVFINGDDVPALGVFYDRKSDTVQPKREGYSSSVRNNLIKTYKVSDENIEIYTRVTSRRYLKSLPY